MEDFEVYNEENKNQDEIKPEEEKVEGTSSEEVKEASSESAEDKTESKKDKKPRTSFIKKHRTASIVTGCLLLSLGGGFAGSMLAMKVNQSNSTVLYQAVDKSSSSSSSNNASGTSLSYADIAKETMDSVVEIQTETMSTNKLFAQAVESGAGSGVILSEDGYIVTNNHVIEGANTITVKTRDGKSYNAKLIGTDSSTDLAVIKIDATGLKPAVLGNSSELQVGDTAIAIGNPLGELGGTVTTGIVSALDREVTIDNQTMHLLQTNAAINPGNSGGGLFNDQGELIGIVNAKSSGSNIEGLGFAIPIDRAKDVITSLIDNGYVKGRASLGVTLTTGTTNNPLSNESSTQVYIIEVQEGSAAAKAGLQAGDQILKVDDTDVEEIADVKTAVNSHKAGETMNITILRDNSTQTIQVTLDEANTSQNQQ
ncbi:trypsin-like peptidase domain-containing protein [Erysipelotrichaceae bacterium HCN-30851]